MKSVFLLCLGWGLAVNLIACGDDEEDKDKAGEGEACDMDAPECEEGMVCEETRDGEPQCAYPIVIRGVVLDATDAAAIEGSTVQAVDPNASATGPSDVADADGAFELTVPAERTADGDPVDSAYTLRAQA